MKCPKCNEEQLFQYKEICTAVETPLTKRGTLSKRKRDISKNDKTYGMPDYIECRACSRTFDYDFEEKGKITKLYCREDY